MSDESNEGGGTRVVVNDIFGVVGLFGGAALLLMTALCVLLLGECGGCIDTAQIIRAVRGCP